MRRNDDQPATRPPAFDRNDRPRRGSEKRTETEDVPATSPTRAAKKRAADAVRAAAEAADTPTKAILCAHVGLLTSDGVLGAACIYLVPMHEWLT